MHLLPRLLSQNVAPARLQPAPLWWALGARDLAQFFALVFVWINLTRHYPPRRLFLQRGPTHHPIP